MAVLVFAVIALFFFKQYQKVKDNPSAAAKATSQRIVERVGQLYFLPPDEEPTVALIEDKSKLANQSFFIGVENGDYLLVYTKAKIALIYREEVNRLVNVGPVNTDQSQQPAGDVAGERINPNQ
ncbi:MAG: hypothetical protein ACREGD_01340 [Candidatus Saccharimonadales bacterium]